MAAAAAFGENRFRIPTGHLEQPGEIPSFWRSTVEEVRDFLKTTVRKGRVETIGKTAGGRPMLAVSYGAPRRGRGTTTFNGSRGYGDVRAYLGPDHDRRVYLAMASVHGGEFEGIAGMVNLLSVIETGADLRGRTWPELTAAVTRLDRIILIPIVNSDGRARIPLRMIRHRGEDFTIQEYFNTGGKPDGSLIGWPDCKRDIPLDFTKTQFPGGYPNDAGVNIQHDDFLGSPQPETRALLALAGRERPDVTLNMHTGATFMHPLRSMIEPALTPQFEQCYRRVMTALTVAGLQQSDDSAKESDPARERMSPPNLETALNLHCGALAMLVESPAHSFSRAKRNGQPFLHTPDHLLDAQLICHQEVMKYLVETGGRARWTPANKRG